MSSITSWKQNNLGDLCKIRIGKTPARSNIAYWDKNKETNNIWLSIADLLNTTNKQVFSSKEFLSDKGANLVPVVEPGTLLLSFKLTIGRVAFAGVPLRTNEAIAQLPIKDPQVLDKNYLYYYLQYYDYEQLLRGDVKVKGKTLNKEKLKILTVQYPTLPEQKRIVEKLDKIFAAIDKAKSQTEKNLQNAKDIFNSYLELLFTQDISDWQERALEDLGNVYTGKTPPTSDLDNFGVYLPFIKPADFYPDGKLNYNNEGLSPKGASKVHVFGKHSILMVCIGATITKIGFSDRPFSCNQQINVLTPKDDNYKFIYYAMSRQEFKNKVLKNSPKTTLPIINKSKWQKLTLLCPSLQKQEYIVAQLESLNIQTQELEKIYTQKLADLEELKQAVLRQAFSGKL